MLIQILIYQPQYGVRGVPSLVLVENGNEVGRLVGAQTKETILNFYNG
jgi:thioredoxin-like negative regulator of GroEL